MYVFHDLTSRQHLSNILKAQGDRKIKKQRGLGEFARSKVCEACTRVLCGAVSSVVGLGSGARA